MQFCSEVLQHVFEYCDLQTLKQCSLANKRFFEISKRSVEKRAWANLGWGDENGIRPIRRYKQVRLVMDFVTPVLDFFDPTAERITHLEMSNGILFEQALLLKLQKRPGIHTLILKDISMVQANEGEDAYLIQTVKHLTAIRTNILSVNFRNLESFVFLLGEEKSFDQENLVEVLRGNNENLKAITLDLPDGFDSEPPDFEDVDMIEIKLLPVNHLRDVLVELQERVQQIEGDGDFLLDMDFLREHEHGMSIDLCRLECLEVRGLCAYLFVLCCFENMTSLRRVNLVDVGSFNIMAFDSDKFEAVEEIWVTHCCCLALDNVQWAYTHLGQTHKRFTGVYKRLRPADVQMAP